MNTPLKKTILPPLLAMCLATAVWHLVPGYIWQKTEECYSSLGSAYEEWVYASLSSKAEAPQGMHRKGGRVLFIGDSLLKDVAPSYLDREGLQGWQFFQETYLGSGLLTDTLDWVGKGCTLQDKLHPGMVIILLGMNDNQAIGTGQKALRYMGKPWIEFYESRMQALMNCFNAPKEVVVWLTVPTVSVQPLSSHLEEMYHLQLNFFLAHHYAYIDLRHVLKGHWQQKDGIHFNQEGVRQIQEKLDQAMLGSSSIISDKH